MGAVKLTDVLNRNSYENNLPRYQKEAVHSLGVIVANIDNLKKIKEDYGTVTGYLPFQWG